MSNHKKFLEDLQHENGNENCKTCTSEYPKECECGGFIHGHIADSSGVHGHFIEVRCDKCGEVSVYLKPVS